MVKRRVGTGSKYSKKEVLQLKDLFNETDADGSGTVSIAEITNSLKRAGKSYTVMISSKALLCE